jgi:hypothetical protein
MNEVDQAERPNPFPPVEAPRPSSLTVDDVAKIAAVMRGVHKPTAEEISYQRDMIVQVLSGAKLEASLAPDLIYSLVRATREFLPKPKETALTKVLLHTISNTAEIHFSALQPDDVFSQHTDPSKRWLAVGRPYILYSGPEPIWGIRCDEVKPTHIEDAA